VVELSKKEQERISKALRPIIDRFLRALALGGGVVLLGLMGLIAVDVMSPVLERPALRWLNALLPLAGARRGDQHAEDRPLPVPAARRGPSSRSTRRSGAR